MTTLVLDIETVPVRLSAENREAVARMAAKREQPVDSFCSLCPALAEVVAVGLMYPENGYYRIGINTRGQWSPPASDSQNNICVAATEAEMLVATEKCLTKVQRLVTFNGRGFDLPVLIHAYARCGLRPPALLVDCARQKPWESAPHVDMLSLFTFGGATGRYSLEAYAIGYGVANPKAEARGSDVAAWVEAGDVASIVHYLLGDLRATAKLYDSWRQQGLC